MFRPLHVFVLNDRELLLPTIITMIAIKTTTIANLISTNRKPTRTISCLSKATIRRMSPNTAPPRPNAAKDCHELPLKNNRSNRWSHVTYTYLNLAELSWRGLACVRKSPVSSPSPDRAGQLATTEGGGLFVSKPRISSRRRRRFK